MVNKSVKNTAKSDKNNVDDYYKKVDNKTTKQTDDKSVKKPLKVRAKKRIFKKKESSANT
jgi:hypothetical protein